MEAPRSIAIIMDGNRRFAKEILKRPAEEGHEFGVKKARELLEWADEVGIKCITAYALSIENMNSRPKKELDRLYEYLDKEMDKILEDDHKVHETETRMRFLGRLELLPEHIQRKMKEIEERTKNYNKHFLNMAIAYGGQQEIVDAMRKVGIKLEEGSIEVKQIDKSLVSENMYLEESNYPDLIIRTGGERRLSNFLLWEAAYSELAFTDERWPEFKKETFLKIIDDYKKRERRFGK
ncbi:MAG: di-trans,poly-cis-decaprenylcistransferase [Candidatus Woesearchaeota archaeon]|nr:MAG: di-trans,poly-cis-decaprenylcistransferase [Candidatus Woesearchaeota archaeon]